MFNCNNLLHPFQNDPGTSQRQRVIDQLLSDSVRIDDRTLADLLDYFAQLSRGIIFYNNELQKSDWQPFFSNSLPFLLASISKYDIASAETKWQLYQRLFLKDPSSSGLQLLIHFVFYQGINRINKWYLEIKEEETAFKPLMQELIRSKLAPLLKGFIAAVNTGVSSFGIKGIDFYQYQNTEDGNVWNLEFKDLYNSDKSFLHSYKNKCEAIRALYEKISAYFPVFLESIRILAEGAQKNIADALIPVEESFRKNHAPHLAMLFAFLRLFEKMQGELNKKKQEHLRFFYSEVLQIKPREASPDKANIVFEVQKILQDQYKKFRLEAGTKLNGGRDDNNADIIFETDDEIIVNEAQIAEVRTLFLSNKNLQIIENAKPTDITYTEGIYMAPRADKADGISKEFKESSPKNWNTLGSRESKLVPSGRKSPTLHPSARIGFMLASPVLYLKEGKRTVTVTLACHMEPACADENAPKYIGSACADENAPKYIDPAVLYKRVRRLVKKKYIVINQDLIQKVEDLGIDPMIVYGIRNFLPAVGVASCYSTSTEREPMVSITEAKWRTQFFNALPTQDIKDSIAEIFTPRTVFKMAFSGIKDWIKAKSVKIRMNPLNTLGNEFVLSLRAILSPEDDPVSFLNKEVYKEDLATELPVVKIELDDEIKFRRGFKGTSDSCCLRKGTGAAKRDLSFYSFFRNVKIITSANAQSTRIDVKVCGLKNFVVQNDENVMDVNGIVYPFGTRPKIGANFYISSKEIFCKDWKELGLTFTWKDKPAKLDDYYHGYEDFLTGIVKADFEDNKYSYLPAFLQNGTWHTPLPSKKPLFASDSGTICTVPGSGEQFYKFNKASFSPDPYVRVQASYFKNEIFTNSSRNHFLRLSLYDPKGLAFHHSRYSYVLSRQMMALGKWPQIYIGPVYDGIPNLPPLGSLPVLNVDEVFNAVLRSYEFSTNIRERTDDLLNAIRAAFAIPPAMTPVNISVPAFRKVLQNPLPFPLPVFNPLPNPLPPLVLPIPPNAPALDPFLLQSIIQQLEDVVLFPVYDKLKDLKDKRVVIPNEPYTPQIQGMTIDYTATATITDIDLIHLLPFTNTYKKENINLTPTLLPTFCEEGILYIGLKQIQPGTNLNLLFQMAEATADSESEPEEVVWQYLQNDLWQPLRNGFEIVEDGTLHLTSTGIIKISLPEKMSVNNTVMPSGLYWLKASVPKNSRSVSETITIHTQAIAATFKLGATNSTKRLVQPLEAGSIARLLQAEPSIKSVSQPYETFGGLLPELEGSYYTRVSEQLRHKGRAIQKWDYERVVLEKFPEIYKTKCINHSFHTDATFYTNDVPYAPGYVMIAVIPDLVRMKAGNSLQPKAPVSLLEKIEATLKKVISPFVRLKVVNPRYEKADFCIRVRLRKGKDENFYKEKLKTDLGEFLAPWSVGKFDKLSFGQCIYRSDVLRFLEQTNYVDFITELMMKHENDSSPMKENLKISPVSPRSILLAGNIDVKIEEPSCDQWCTNSNGVKECKGPELFNDYCEKKS